jgi:hypothetical protein
VANRYFTQFFYSFFKKPVLIAGSIPLSASAAVGTVAIKGVLSVVKSGTGIYTVTLEDEYYKLIYANGGIIDSAENLKVVFTDFDLPNKTFKVKTMVAGSFADVTDACEISLCLVLSNSTVD